MIHSDITNAKKQLGIELPTLEKLAESSELLIHDFKERFNEIMSEKMGSSYHDSIKNTDVVLLGSIARRESTYSSDCDYYILQNGSSPEITQKLIRAIEAARESLGVGEPGSQGVFGEIVVAPNLYEIMGLEKDSNANMTRRILLLAESEPISSGITHKHTIRNILLRYCADYSPSNEKGDHPVKVPRYLVTVQAFSWPEELEME